MPSEFELIRRYFTTRTPGAVLGVGDDAALLRASPGTELAVTTDMLVAGTHFFADVDPKRLGHKALAVNLSDIAAMGATPRWALLSMALPRADERWLRSFSAGLLALARRHKVDLVGGDTTRGPLNLCITVIGEVARGKALRRDGARRGDDIWVSGQLGDAALALAHRLGRIRLSTHGLARALRRLELPQPRLALGVGLVGLAHSAIDLSDGLVADLGHICERSGLGAEVQFDQLPRSPLLRQHDRTRVGQDALLAGGDDYELCFTTSPRMRPRIESLAKRLRIRLTRIGRMRAGDAVQILDPRGRAVAMSRRGFDHFG